jgi:hypothetical protein
MIFVSYSRSDVTVTRQLIGALEMMGESCWLDESNIPVGQAESRASFRRSTETRAAGRSATIPVGSRQSNLSPRRAYKGPMEPNEPW